MAFIPSAIDGECCDPPCDRDSPCEKCCECKVADDQFVKVTYEVKKVTSDAGQSDCQMAYAVCVLVEYFYPLDNLCGYDSKGPTYVPELKEWQLGSYAIEDEECTNKGLGTYYGEEFFPSGGTTQVPVYKVLTVEDWNNSGSQGSVMQIGIYDSTGCGGCDKDIEFDCEAYEDESGGTGLPLCSDPDLEKPCSEGPYPIEGEGDEPCCPSDANICGNDPEDCGGSGITGSGIQGSGTQGSGCVPCCEETNDCTNIPPCCARDEAGEKELPDCPADGACCDGSEPVCGSGVQGSGTQGSGTQGSGCCTETNDCGECCDDPPDCECDDCYDGDPTTEYYCTETITDDCTDVDFTEPTSNC